MFWVFLVVLAEKDGIFLNLSALSLNFKNFSAFFTFIEAM